jgi:hypothetical protein
LEDFLQSKNSLGLNCITDEIENELDIFIKMLVILYADDTVLFADSAVNLFHKPFLHTVSKALAKSINAQYSFFFFFFIICINI